MQFRILGPLDVVDDRRSVELGGQKLRVLLAVLLLHANEVVSSDVLIDALWGERPPATAGRTLQAHVSRLRRALGGNGSAGRLETRASGYLLKLGVEELDADVARATLESARQALAAGEAELAAKALSEALKLWRGAPLADVAYESFAQTEIARLEELKLLVQEERVEAELARGRHVEVVPELEALVRNNPLRERLLGQLMVALYRSGRHAEALHAYQEGRRSLSEELGLQPSERLRTLEHQILEHDPELGPRRSARHTAHAPIRRRARVAVVTGGLLLAAAISMAVVRIVEGAGGAGQFDVAGNAVVALDTRSGDPKTGVESPVAPSALAVGHGYIWAVSADSSAVVVLDPETNTVRDSITVESAPGGVAVGHGWVWVTNSLTGTVSRISPETLSVVETIPVGNGPTGIAAGNGYVWVSNTGDHTISKLREADGKLVGTFAAGPDPGAIALGAGAVWVASRLESVVRKVDPESGDVIDRIAVGDGPVAVTVGAGSVWVAGGLSGTVSQLDPRSGVVRATVEVGPSADAVAVARGDVWAASGPGSSVSRIDASSGRLTETNVVGSRPTALAEGRGNVYVGLRPSGASHVGGTLRVLVDRDGPPMIDPAKAYAPLAWQVLALTNDGLVGWRRAGGQAGTEVVPDLAVSLPSVSDEGRTYTFQLRRGVRYSDGRPLRARDVRFSIERLYKVKPEPEQAALHDYGGIVGADECARRPARCDLSRGIVTDDKAGTVVFHLVARDPEFMFKLALPFGSVLPTGTTLREAVVRPLPGTGPYRIATASRDGSLRLVRNPRFSEWSSAAQPAGFPDEIVIATSAEPRQRPALVARSRADLAPLTWTRPLDLAPADQPRLHVQPLPAVFYLVLDTTRPPFDDLRARRALNYAVDRGKAARLGTGSHLSRPTCQVLPPNLPGYEPTCPYTLDPKASARWAAPDMAKARRLVEASGTSGREVVLWWHRDFGARAGRYLEHLLDTLGYHARLRLFSGDIGKYYEALSRPGASWQLFGDGWSADYPAASNFVNLLSCSSPYNRGRFCDRAIDAKINGALRLQERDPASANPAWAAIDRELTDRAGWVSLYTPYGGDLVSRRVGNYQHHPLLGALLGQLWVR